MTPKFKQILRDNSGMTLLEIMIVLAILGGLIAVLATNVMSSFKKANVEQTKIQMSQVENALNMFYTDCGFYPSSLEELVTASPNCSNWGPDPYLKDMPKDKWGSPFVYEVDGSNFLIISLGEDRREGGEGLAKDIRSDE